MSDFSKNLKKQMEIRNLSQAQLSRTLGVSRQAVSRWLKGDVPSMVHVHRTADILNCRVDDLIETDKPQGELEITQIYRDLDEERQKQLLDFGRWLYEKR